MERRERREPVQFLSNTPVEVSFKFGEGKLIDTAFGQKTMYSTTDGRVIFAETELATKINYCEPQPGDTLWITKKQVWAKNGRSRKATKQTFWEVSTSEPGVVRRDGYQDTQANAEATGIDETDLERQLRESREIKEKAQARNQAKDNVARMPEPPAFEDIPHPAEAETPRKPPVMESQPTPPAPEPPKSPERYSWFPNTVEVARSYTYKLNTGNYETRDFFCSQKAECRPEDADLVSEKLYDFCKRQVMKAVAAETGRKSA